MRPRELNVTFRCLQTWDEYLAAEEVQRAIWYTPDWRGIVPADLMCTAQKHGGIALGAFDAPGRLVGLVFSFLGVDEASGSNTLKHCSHLLAVLPEYRGQQIGLRLKLKQREIALAQNVALMTWTYDPLLALNAHFNIARLGAIARRYIVNAYGAMSDTLNAGLPSDRLEAEWWLTAPRVQARVARAEARGGKSRDAPDQPSVQEIFRIGFDAQALPRIERADEPRAEVLLIEIPAEFATLKNAAFDLAQEWRKLTRETFQRVFAAGYGITDFIFESRRGARRAAYVLTRKTSAQWVNLPEGDRCIERHED